MQKRQLGPCVTFFPQPTTLVATRDENDKINLMMASWVGIVSKTPPTIAVSLNHKRKTLANIRVTKDFSINLVNSELAVAADACGLISGHDADKQAITGIKTVAAELTGAPLVEQSPLNVECRYVQEVELGDYRLVMAEILEIHAIEAAFDDAGKADVAAFDPLAYLGGIREYRALGDQVADAYKSGLELLPKK
ncbi:MAG: flavin reductase family protein [Desulfuromonadales bacterium]|nr:flavin reductase family protein [Desulfuromonadales bacterium]